MSLVAARRTVPRHAGAWRIADELWRCTRPVIGSHVLALGLNFAELYYAGLIGRQALLGVVIAATWTTFVYSLALASFTSGVTREITIQHARGVDLVRPVWTVLVSGVSIGVAVWVVLGLGGTAILRAAGLGGEALGHGTAYLHVTSAAFPALFVIGGFQGVMRGIGEPGVGHRVLATGIVLTLVSSPALALGWGLGLGAAGLGAGNVLAFTVAAAAALAVILRRWRPGASGPARAFGLDWPALRRIAHVTAPSATVWLGVSLTLALLQRMMSALGEDFLVSFTVVLRLEPIAGTVASAFAAALLYVVGTYYALGQTRRGVLALRIQQLLFLATIAPAVLVLEAWPRAWAGLFTNAPGVLTIADLNTRYFLLSLPFIGMAQVVSALFSAFGRPMAGLRVFVVKNLVLLVPSLFVTVWCLGVRDPHVIFLVQLTAAPFAWLYSEVLLRRWRTNPSPAGAPSIGWAQPPGRPAPATRTSSSS